MNLSSSAECPPPPCPLKTQGSGQDRGGAFDHEYEGRGDAIEDQQHGRDQKRQPVGLIERQILGHHLADHHVHEADRQECEGETRSVQIHFPRRRERKREQPQDGVVQRLFAGPAQPQTRQRDADLGDAQQPFRDSPAAPARRARKHCPERPAPSSRERRTDTSATSAAAKKPFTATMASSNVKRRDILVR